MEVDGNTNFLFVAAALARVTCDRFPVQSRNFP